MYTDSQLQRGMERRIRQSKNRLTALDEQGKVTLGAEQKNAFAAESVRLKAREGKLKDFCKQTGRRSDSLRTRTASWNRSTSQKAVWANKKAVDNKGRSGIISYKFSDRIINLHNENDKGYSFEEIADAMKTSAIGRDFAEYISSNGYIITMNYDVNVQHDICGLIRGKDVEIYVFNHRNAEEIACTIIHEVSHERYNWKGTQEKEINCYLMELMHKKQRLTESDIINVVNFVREEYSFLPEGDLYEY